MASLGSWFFGLWKSGQGPNYGAKSLRVRDVVVQGLGVGGRVFGFGYIITSLASGLWGLKLGFGGL